MRTYIVSMYAKGQRMAGDCLPEMFMSYAAAYAAGQDEVARVAAIAPAERHPQIDWAVRFTIRAEEMSNREIAGYEHMLRYNR